MADRSGPPDRSGPFLAVPGAEGLRPGRALRFRFRREGGDEEGLLLRHGAGLAAYRNLCRHDEVSLDCGDGEFFTDDGRHLRCRVHGALYRPGDGVCVAGPCEGESLESFPVERVGGIIGVRLAPGDEPQPAPRDAPR
jgi:nitrite reductase/ring-hydroxylating ferredoxin subunit